MYPKIRRFLKVTIPALALIGSTGLVLAQSAPAFLESFAEGVPAQPADYTNPHNWDIFVQGYDSANNGTAAQVAQHGPNCEPPGFPYTAANTHPLTSENHSVFICNNHVMTATGNSGYAAIYMTPPAVADFSNGEATISWEMSTLRTAARDWVDVVLTPFDEHSSFAYNNNDQHIPPNNIHLTLAGTNVWQVYQHFGGGLEYLSGTDVLLPGDGATTWDDVFRSQGTEESAARRDRFDVRLSRTHISICMTTQLPNGGVFCWVNTNLAQPLDPAVWHDQATVMFGHRSYNVLKSCSEIEDQAGIDYATANCPPNTWHWSNVSIQPAVPYQIIPSKTEVNNASGGTVNFAGPAQQGAYLSFVQFSHTPDLRVSFDGGATWQAPHVQPARAPNGGASEENGEQIFTPMPAGVSSVQVRGSNGFWGSFATMAFAIYNPPNSAVEPLPTTTATSTVTVQTPTATASATGTATVTAVPSATPVPSATSMPTVTSTPAPGDTCTVIGFRNNDPKLFPFTCP